MTGFPPEAVAKGVLARTRSDTVKAVDLAAEMRLAGLAPLVVQLARLPFYRDSR